MNKRMRTVYPREFKIRAVEQAKQGGRSIRQLERDLGLSESLLRNWVQEYDKYGEHAWIREATPFEVAFSSPEALAAGKEGGQATTAAAALATEEQRLRLQLEHLQRQYQQLQQDNAILKKALTIFAQEPK